MKTFFRKSLLVSVLALGAVVVGQNASADPGDTLRWQSLIGIIQGSNVVGSGTGAFTGSPGPWTALGGNAKVDVDRGQVSFITNGLVLAAGNSIGTPGTVLQVRGTLVCDTDGSASGGNSVFVDTLLVDLDDQGDSHFNGNVGALPAVCATEPDIAFLIRNAGGKWIANGTVLR